jgi:cell division protein FtsB
LLVQERKSDEGLKKLIALEKSKIEKLDQGIAQSKETTCRLKSSIGALQGQHDVLQKTHQDLEVQFDALWSSTSKTSSDPRAPNAFTSKGCERCYNLDSNALCDKSQSSKVEQVLVESCDEAIGNENDHLKREVKRLEFQMNKLKKQTKVQSSQDNRSNMVKKLETGRTAPKVASQQQSKFITRRKKGILWMKKLNMQEAPT